MAVKRVGKRAERARKGYFRILKYQAVILIGLVSLLSLFDWVMAYSAFLGGCVYLIPMVYLGRRHLGDKGEETAQSALMQLYAGQIWKMVFMAVGYSLIFVLVDPLSAFSLFASLIVLHLAYLVLQISSKTNF